MSSTAPGHRRVHPLARRSGRQSRSQGQPELDQLIQAAVHEPAIGLADPARAGNAVKDFPDRVLRIGPSPSNTRSFFDLIREYPRFPSASSVCLGLLASRWAIQK